MNEITRVVYYPSPGKVFTREELIEIFSRFSVNDSVILALRQIFQARFASAALDAATPNLTERAAGHAGGRISEITDFRNELLEYLQSDVKEGEEQSPVHPKSAYPRSKYARKV